MDLREEPGTEAAAADCPRSAPTSGARSLLRRQLPRLPLLYFHQRLKTRPGRRSRRCTPAGLADTAAPYCQGVACEPLGLAARRESAEFARLGCLHRDALARRRSSRRMRGSDKIAFRRSRCANRRAQPADRFLTAGHRRGRPGHRDRPPRSTVGPRPAHRPRPAGGSLR